MAVVLQDGSSDWSCQTFPLRPAGWWNSLILRPAPRSARTDLRGRGDCVSWTGTLTPLPRQPGGGWASPWGAVP